MFADPPETSELQAFVAVVDAGSVSGAARDLGVPRATVSRRLARLEERLGTVLIRRTTRLLRLTEAGEELFRHARDILGSVERAMRSVRLEDSTPRGLLRVSVPPVADPRFHGMLLGFLEEHPAVRLELIATTEHQDLVADNIDVALRAGTTLDPGLVARRVATTDLVCLASPGYLARHGRPRTLDALVEHACLVGFAKGARPATHWPTRDGGRVRVRHALAANDLELVRAACVRGHGLAMLPRSVVAGSLDRGDLVPVLEDVLGTRGTVSLVYAERRLMRPAVRAFIDHAASWWREHGREVQPG